MIEKRPLGKDGPHVGVLGYRAMVLEDYYGPSDDNEAAGTVHRALDTGMTMIDSADAYGNGHNERLVGRAIRARRDAFVASKFGIVFEPGETGTDLPTGLGFSLKVNGSPDYARRALDATLARLGVDSLDLWYLHYPDPAIPIEETVAAIASAVRAGKARHLGLSNVTAEQVRRAHAIHPIAAVQYEYSLWRREADASLLPTLRELGIALVAWSPLGAGFVAGAVRNLAPRIPGSLTTASRSTPTASSRSCRWRESCRLRGHSLPSRGYFMKVLTCFRSLARESRHGSTRTRRPRRRGSMRIQLGRIDALARPGLAEGGTLV